MTLTIYPPLVLNEVGGRANNEDSVYPAPGKATANDRLFLVCDGMGGLAKGEEASRLVAQAIADFFGANPGPSSEATVAIALQQAEQAIDSYLAQNEDAKGMGTTLTLLHLHERGATIAHVGDSRIYQCRAGKVIFRTDDHKLVTEWVKAGVLTPEQAEDHPQRNVITRAVQGRKARPTQADVQQLTDVQANDYFLLCTDGLLEQLTDDLLEEIIGREDTDEQKMAAIRTLCEGRTQDNFSAYLVHLETVEVTLPPMNTVLPAETNLASEQNKSPTGAPMGASASPLPVLPVEAIPPAPRTPAPEAAPTRQPPARPKPATPAARPTSPVQKPWWKRSLGWMLLAALALGLTIWQLSKKEAGPLIPGLDNNSIPQSPIPIRPSKH